MDSLVLQICVVTLLSLNTIIAVDLSIHGPASCGGNFTYQDGDFCYAFVSEPKSWSAAQAVCRGIGGYLAEIKTEEQNHYIEGIMWEHPEHKDIWLGATELVVKGLWTWDHSDTPVHEEFTFWGIGEPDKGVNQEHCMEFFEIFRHWNNAPCEDKQSFVCQKSVAVAIG